jgi:hypothetical protein
MRTRVALAQNTSQSAWVGTAHNGLWTMSRLSVNNYGYSSYTCGWGGPSRVDFGTGYTGYHVIDAIKKAASFATIADGTQLVDNGGNICSSDPSWLLNGGASYGNNAISIDWVAIRKWVANDPATGNISFGAEGAGQ